MIPDCGGHVGETFVGHVRPGQYVSRDGMLMVRGGWRVDREWTDDDERANPMHAVCPSCAKLAHESAATIPEEPPVPVDPLAALRDEAAFMLAAGCDARDVLGTLDLAVQAIARGESLDAYGPQEFLEQVAMVTLHRASMLIVNANESHHKRRCYHGHPARLGACGWCAIAATRSDAR